MILHVFWCFEIALDMLRLAVWHFGHPSIPGSLRLIMNFASLRLDVVVARRVKFQDKVDACFVFRQSSLAAHVNKLKTLFPAVESGPKTKLS